MQAVGWTIRRGVSQALSLGKYKPKINGDGQECPSQMDRQLAIE